MELHYAIHTRSTMHIYTPVLTLRLGRCAVTAHVTAGTQTLPLMLQQCTTNVHATPSSHQPPAKSPTWDVKAD
jgi:hypothetical protein